ncbi:MAG: hypothetical protein ACLVB1_07025 [Blautia obeum]
MVYNGYARSIRPVHTSADGDSIYALSVGKLPLTATWLVNSADVMSEAILCCKNAELFMAIRSAKILLL